MMKRIITVFLVFLLLSLTLTTAAAAVTLPLRIVVNGERIFLPDAQPFVDQNQRTQVPVRFVSEALGANVNWDSKNRKVTIKMDGRTIVLYIGKKEYELNGAKKQMDTHAQIKDGRTFVPIRFISEALGANVKWEAAIRTVYINTDGQAPPVEGIQKAEINGFTFFYSEMAKTKSTIYITESGMAIGGSNEPGLAIIGMEILYLGNPMEGANEVEAILQQKIEAEVVRSIMNYIRSKETREDPNLAFRTFTDSRYKVNVFSISDFETAIYVYHK